MGKVIKRLEAIYVNEQKLLFIYAPVYACREAFVPSFLQQKM